MIGNYGLKHFSNGGDAGSWKLEFSNRKEQLPQTARHIAVIMLAVLKIEVGEQKICPTAFLNSYSCCTQPYILTPLTLYYAFFGFCMKWRLHVISLTSCIVICVYTCIFKKKKCCVYSVVSFFFFTWSGLLWKLWNQHIHLHISWWTKVACQVLFEIIALYQKRWVMKINVGLSTKLSHWPSYLTKVNSPSESQT